MKKNIFYILSLLFIIVSLLVLTYIFMDLHAEYKDKKEMEFAVARNRLFEVFLDLYTIQTIEHYKEVVKDRHYSLLSQEGDYLCFAQKEEKRNDVTKHCIVVFIKKNVPDTFYCFLITYENLEVSYFDSNGSFYILKEFDNNLLINNTSENQDKLIKCLFDLVLNKKKLKEISKEQFLRGAEVR